MNILTFDIEDWYNVDFITEDFAWDKYEVRIYEGVEGFLRGWTHQYQGVLFLFGLVGRQASFYYPTD